MRFREFRIKRILQGNLQHGVDLYEGLLKIVTQENINSGIITGIGAVWKATIAYLNQSSKEYEKRVFNEGLEVTGLHGNVSLKEGEIFLHAHITLSNSHFNAIGGHLLPGTVVYAFEFEILELEGDPFERVYDRITNLFLWK